MHHGLADRVRAHRWHVLTAAEAAHPEPGVQGTPRPAAFPQGVWMKRSERTKPAQDAPGTTIVTSVDLQAPLMSSPGEASATTMTDRGGTLMTWPTVSHGP